MINEGATYLLRDRVNTRNYRQPHRVNSLRPGDAYMRQKTSQHCFRQWLVAWPAPSHYLNQYWDIVNWTLRNKLQWNFNRNSYIFIQENAFQNVVWKMAAILSRPQCVKTELHVKGLWFVGFGNTWLYINACILLYHDDVIKWKYFPCYRSPVNSLTKASDAVLLCFLWTLSDQRLSQQSWRMWLETPSQSLWRHCNDIDRRRFNPLAW